ncbi:hypothetical protein PIB30_055229 [Stylosanthes scabra]|uniref:Ubiquitin-like protease family profile domain-containing protein n=1 Tax=Stylosanthes scabra TaxID=79078 RepID=A0ABU6UJG2_9FABA|nr:hypothetical protein [Stylosanthes scabra]
MNALPVTCMLCPTSCFYTQIFIPILDVPDAWYLMLLDVKKSRVYCLDVSGDDEDRERRAADWEKICLVLSQLFSSRRNIVHFMHTSLNPTNWGEIIYPEALPRNVNTYEARMRAALYLVNWEHNEVGVALIGWQRSFGKELHVETNSQGGLVWLDF